MTIVTLLLLIFLVIVGVVILKDILKIIGMLIIVFLVVWFLGKEGFIDVKFGDHQVSITDTTQTQQVHKGKEDK